MSSQNLFRPDKGVRQGKSNSYESQTIHKNMVAANADYYSEWATEKTPIERPKSGLPGNSVGTLPGNGYQSRSISNKNKKVNKENGNANSSTYYNEIYNRAELFSFP